MPEGGEGQGDRAQQEAVRARRRVGASAADVLYRPAARRGVDDAHFPGGLGMGAGGRRGLLRWWQPSQRPYLLPMM